MFVAGQLALDRRQHLPHLALARTTPATVRYTALPWQWIREEFRLRSPGSTTLFVDLHADAEAWGWLHTHALDSGRNNAVFGRIAPPPSRRTVAGPAYMKTIATILRSGWRPPVEQLHQQAFTRLGPDAYGDLVLTVPPVPVAAPGSFAARPSYLPERPRPQAPVGPVVPAPPPQDPQDPHAYIAAAVQNGRHQDAEAVATAHQEAAACTQGPASEQALHWSEVRADLAMFAGDPVRSCRIWLTVAEARLGAGQAVDSRPVETAVDRAHHQWAQVRDVEQVRQLGIVLAGLRMRVPGRRQGALENVQTQLRRLQTQS